MQFEWVPCCTRTPTHRDLVRPISVLHVEKIPPFTLTFTLKRPLFLRKC